MCERSCIFFERSCKLFERSDKILERAVHDKVDVIGRSGLNTPSLDETVYVVEQMEASGMQQPFMLDGVGADSHF